MGRPSLLEDPHAAPRVEAFLRAVAERGMSAAGAADLSGIGESTLYQWLEKASEDNAPPHYTEFAERFAQARAVREADYVEDIRESSIPTKDGGTLPDWRARAWLLERLEPARYGARQHVTQETTHHVKAWEITGDPLPEQAP